MTTLKTGNERKPPPERLVPITFRPAHATGHRIADGENWHSLAKRYRLPVEQLIQSNFRTLVPQEINWYLREYVNCDTPTPDRYNWRFSTSARRGPSPRAGTIFIVPNWPVIVQTAKAATQAFVLDWFRNAHFGPAPVTEGNLVHMGGSLRSQSFLLPAFRQRLQAGGATDALAEQWEAALRRVLEQFTSTLAGGRPNAFPPTPVAVGRVEALPWPLLQSAAIDEHERLFQQMLPRDLAGDGPALQAVRDYVMWFKQAFDMLRSNAQAVGVVGVGTHNPLTGRLIGSALAQPGFLRPLVMLP
jgi:hypothetical protein